MRSTWYSERSRDLPLTKRFSSGTKRSRSTAVVSGANRSARWSGRLVRDRFRLRGFWSFHTEHHSPPWPVMEHFADEVRDDHKEPSDSIASSGSFARLESAISRCFCVNSPAKNRISRCRIRRWLRVACELRAIGLRIGGPRLVRGSTHC